jgi:Xaa-Pro aminopeptidase
VHYRATPATNRKLLPGTLYLIDSGAQYLDGTTDVTRTVAIGEPTDEMRRHYTLVLKGHIGIASARFPKDTRGVDIDGFARRALWAAGLNYGHGTGHGIGSFLSVHEGPQSISPLSTVALEPGMIVSNEPGYYREGYYGIRLENLCAVTEPEAIEGGEIPMLGFETLTLAPFDRRLIVQEMLTAGELEWLNGYHARVLKALAPLLKGGAAKWLKAACAAV